MPAIRCSMSVLRYGWFAEPRSVTTPFSTPVSMLS